MSFVCFLLAQVLSFGFKLDGSYFYNVSELDVKVDRKALFAQIEADAKAKELINVVHAKRNMDTVAYDKFVHFANLPHIRLDVPMEGTVSNTNNFFYFTEEVATGPHVQQHIFECLPTHAARVVMPRPYQ